MLESPFTGLAGFKTCNFLKKRLRHSCFPVNVAKILRTLILMKILQTTASVIPTSNFCFCLSVIPTVKGLFLLLIQQAFFKGPLQCLKSSPQDVVVIRCTTRCHSFSLVVIHCTTRCHSLYHSLSLAVIRCHSLYYLLSLVVTGCATRLSFYKRS